jgi:hypothetical protein
LHSCGFGQKKSRTTETNDNENGGRPTDGSEGIPGYLVKPERIVFQSKKNSIIKIIAPKGTIKAGEEKIDNLRVDIWQITPKEINKYVKEQDESQVTLKGDLRGTADPDKDGSFTVEVKNESDNPYVFLVRTKKEKSTLEIETNDSGKSSGNIVDFADKYFETYGKVPNLPNFSRPFCSEEHLTNALDKNGQGTANEPYIICTLSQLNEV